MITVIVTFIEAFILITILLKVSINIKHKHRDYCNQLSICILFYINIKCTEEKIFKRNFRNT